MVADTRGLRYDGYQLGIQSIAPVGLEIRSTIRAIGTRIARANWQNLVRRNTNFSANEAA